MAKRKTTLTIDGDDLDEVRRLTGAASASEAVGQALTRLIRAARLRRDLEAYGVTGPTGAERALAEVDVDHRDLDDDTDWEALYAEDAS